MAGDESHALDAGHVGRPHGLDGSFYVTRPRARLLTLGAEVTVAGRAAPIVRRAGTDARPILRLEGFEDRTAVEALRGERLTVEAVDAPLLAEGEWWAHELEGCDVIDGERRLGVVRRLIELPSCEALEVSSEGQGTTLLIPMVKEAIRHVDVASRRIAVNVEFLDISTRVPAESTPAARGHRGAGSDAPEDPV